MKAYSNAVAAPDYDFSSTADWSSVDQKYYAATEADLRKKGFTGKYTGKVVRFGVADGAAEYMVAHRGGRMVLVHLETCDAYSLDTFAMRGLTRKDVIERCMDYKELKV